MVNLIAYYSMGGKTLPEPTEKHTGGLISRSSADLSFAMPKVAGGQRHHIKIGRNAPCPCGSGKKYKKCCIDKPESLLNDMLSEGKNILS